MFDPLQHGSCMHCYAVNPKYRNSCQNAQNTVDPTEPGMKPLVRSKQGCRRPNCRIQKLSLTYLMMWKCWIHLISPSNKKTKVQVHCFLLLLPTPLEIRQKFLQILAPGPILHGIDYFWFLPHVHCKF